MGHSDEDASYLDEELRLEAEEEAARNKEVAAMSESEREEYFAKQAERAAKKDQMLRTQLALYGKNPVLGSKRSHKGKGREPKHKPATRQEPDAYDVLSDEEVHESDVQEEPEELAKTTHTMYKQDSNSSKKSAGSMRMRKAQRQKQLDLERETRRALKQNQKSKQHDTLDPEAEDRRKSRLRKMKDIQRELEDSDDEPPNFTSSLLDRLRVPSYMKRSRRQRASVDTADDIDDTPLSLALWVYLIFLLVAMDRSVKFMMLHTNAEHLSKLLGTILIVASFGVKVPQIASIVQAKTVKGLSPIKSYTSILSLVLTVVYSVANQHPFTSWGDSFSILLQELIIVALIWTYGDTSLITEIVYSVTFFIFSGTVATSAMKSRPEKLWPMPILASVIALSGALPQILENYANKHTGPLSFITQLMIFLGLLVRVFTTLTEVNDPIVLGSVILSTIVNGIMLAQIILYWGNTKLVLAREARKSRTAKSL